MKVGGDPDGEDADGSGTDCELVMGERYAFVCEELLLLVKKVGEASCEVLLAWL